MWLGFFGLINLVNNADKVALLYNNNGNVGQITVENFVSLFVCVGPGLTPVMGRPVFGI